MMTEIEKLIKLVNDATKEIKGESNTNPNQFINKSIAIEVAAFLEDRGLSHKDVIEIMANIIGATIKTAGIHDPNEITSVCAGVIQIIYEITGF